MIEGRMKNFYADRRCCTEQPFVKDDKQDRGRGEGGRDEVEGFVLWELGRNSGRFESYTPL